MPPLSIPDTHEKCPVALPITKSGARRNLLDFLRGFAETKDLKLHKSRAQTHHLNSLRQPQDVLTDMLPVRREGS